jgi:hypothetical protein
MLGGELPQHVEVIAEDVAVRISVRQMTARERHTVMPAASADITPS